ncbi:MAG: hypothetical protein WBO49_02565 [Candidatus Saccharimonas sp.]
MTKGRAMTHPLLRELVAKTIREKVEEGFHLMVISSNLKKMVYEIAASPAVDRETIELAHEYITRRLESHICWGSVAVKIESSPSGSTVILTKP